MTGFHIRFFASHPPTCLQTAMNKQPANHNEPLHSHTDGWKNDFGVYLNDKNKRTIDRKRGQVHVYAKKEKQIWGQVWVYTKGEYTPKGNRTKGQVEVYTKTRLTKHPVTSAMLRRGAPSDSGPTLCMQAMHIIVLAFKTLVNRKPLEL